MGREASPHAGVPRHAPKLRARRRGRPRPPARRSVDDAEQRPNRQLDAHREPRLELLPGPVVHAHLAAAAALAASHQQRSATRVQVGFGERERLVDTQAGAPEHDDQPTQPAAVHAVAGGAHNGDDLLHRRWVGRVADPLVARRPASMEVWQRGW